MKSSVAESVTITPVLVADLYVEGERMPICVHVIDHPDGRVPVDTGMTELHPLLADMDPRLQHLGNQDFDIAGIDLVVNRSRAASVGAGGIRSACGSACPGPSQD